jgi:FkbM family methyltransferase
MLNWSGIDPRSLHGRILRLPGRLLPAGSVIRIRSGPARGMKWIVGSAVHGCWLGTYELQKQRALEHFVRPGMTVYDVGAQAGFYTLFFSRLVGNAGRVFAFEPCPYESCFLADHMRINRPANVRVIQAAVGQRRGFIGMTTDRGTCQNQTCDGDSELFTVPCLSLDGSDLPPADLIKIDVEGAESDVLGGARRMLREVRPVVFVALHNAGERANCAMLLRESRYVIYDLNGGMLDNLFDVDEIYALPREPRS